MRRSRGCWSGSTLPAPKSAAWPSFRTIIVVEHDMAFVRQLGAPVTVLHYGRVFAEGSLAAIEGNEDVRNIYLGASRTMAVRGRHH